ncbi:MAG TPA: DUF5715 family protein [Longimicrobiaceae bacterium]|nr:DUF5715 family protein [Longimicrobiaceae bacterium]
MIHHRSHTPLLVLLALLFLPTALVAQSLHGSHASVERMYDHATNHDIYFYKTARGIRNAAKKGVLVELRGNSNYTTHGVSFPYVRSPTRTFVRRLAAEYRSACGERLVVTSASRPRSMQLVNSVDKSVHPAGIAVDLRKSNRRSCRNWLRRVLLSLEAKGVVEATEEHHPPHFHVAVFPVAYTRYVARLTGGAKYASSRSDKYRVRPGDSLWAIARRNDTTVQRLKEANDLNSSSIRIGQTLVIPSTR